MQRYAVPEWLMTAAPCSMLCLRTAALQQRVDGSWVVRTALLIIITYGKMCMWYTGMPCRHAQLPAHRDILAYNRAKSAALHQQESWKRACN